MSDATQKALDVLVGIAQDEDVEPDTRIRAAATILGDAKLRRHRLFETNFPLRGTPCKCVGDPRPVIDVSGGGPTHAPRRDNAGGRTYKGTVAQKREAMGIDWMTGAELVEAVPPWYTDLVGYHLRDYLRRGSGWDAEGWSDRPDSALTMSDFGGSDA